MRIFLAIAALVFAPSHIQAQDAIDVLTKAAATVRALAKSSYDFEEVQVREWSGSGINRTEDRARLAGSGGRYRTERIPAGPLYLFDGSYRWGYNPERNEYTRERDPGILADYLLDRSFEEPYFEGEIRHYLPIAGPAEVHHEGYELFHESVRRGSG